MNLALLDHLGSIASILGLIVGLPAIFLAAYQMAKARQEARQLREGTWHSKDCLEFVTGDGTCINFIPLETLHSLPREGDVIMLPGDGMEGSRGFLPAAYLVESIEHIYTPATHKRHRPHEARLTKAVARVTTLNPTFDELMASESRTENRTVV